MANSPRPPRVSHKISVATLVNGQRVINCWDYWMGGFEIVHRHPVDDPSAVLAAADWAVANRAHWESGPPVRSVDEVVRRFTH
jgi:hypothetical protein